MTIKTGDTVLVTTETGRTVIAYVKLASKNGRSLALTFDAMIGGWLGGLAAFQQEDGTWTALDNTPLQIVRLNDYEIPLP
jgi:hypothetical protein